MSTLTNALKTIMRWLTKNKPQSVASFLPSLSLDEIYIEEQRIGYEFPEEIYELYQWRNGTTEDCWSLFFPSIGYSPFDEAVSISKAWNSMLSNIKENTKEKWCVYDPLFIFLTEESDCCAIPLQPKQDNKQMPVVCFGEGEMPYIYFTSLTAMMMTLAECCETGAYYLNPDGWICENRIESSRIFRKYNSDLVLECLNTLQLLILDKEELSELDILTRVIYAITDMGRFQDPTGISILLEAFQIWENKNNSYRDPICVSIVNTLGKIEDRKVLETLSRASRDRSHKVREEAQAAWRRR